MVRCDGLGDGVPLADRHSPKIAVVQEPGAFEIDGNFGPTAGVAEMLLQSHRCEVHLLPALPSAWPSGLVAGLCARGGFEVDIAWSGGAMTGGCVRSKLGRSISLRTHAPVTTTVDGQTVTSTEDPARPGEWTLEFDTAPSEAYELTVVR